MKTFPYYSLVMLLSVLLLCCKSGNKKVENIEIESMSPSDSLTVYLGLPVQMKYYDNKLFVTDAFPEHGFINVIDIKSDSLLFRFATRGNGPSEYLSVANVDIYNDSTITYVGILDPMTNIYRQYNYDSLLHIGTQITPQKEKKISSAENINELFKLDGFYLATGFFEKNKFAILNDSLEIIEYLGSYRPKPNKDVSDITHAYANYGTSFLSSNKLSLGNISYISSTLTTYSLNQSVNEAWDYIGQEMNYTVEDGMPNNALVTGYISVTGTDTHIYALYSGLKEDPEDRSFYGKELHVFDSSGNIVRKTNLQRDIMHICADVDNNRLYGLAHDPEPRILIYKL